MAHPDHDQVIGRLAGARLRGSAERRRGDATVEPHPDAETWAAYVDGGLLPDEVGSLETHLAACAVCRRLVAALVPEVSTAAAPVVRSAEPAASGPATIIAFPRRHVIAWMGIAAGLFGAVTLWSVSRLGSDAPVLEVAATTQPVPAATAPDATAPPASVPSAAAPLRREAPAAERDARQSASAAPRASAPADMDKLKADAGAGARRRCCVGDPAGRREARRRDRSAGQRQRAPDPAADELGGGGRAPARPARGSGQPAAERGDGAAPRHTRCRPGSSGARRSRRAGARAGRCRRRGRAPARQQRAGGRTGRRSGRHDRGRRRPSRPSEVGTRPGSGGGGKRSRRRRGLEGRSGEDAGLRRRGVHRGSLVRRARRPSALAHRRGTSPRVVERWRRHVATPLRGPQPIAIAVANGNGAGAASGDGAGHRQRVGGGGARPGAAFLRPGRMDGRGAAGCGDADRGVGDRPAVGAGHRRRWACLRDRRRRRDVDARDARGWSP